MNGLMNGFLQKIVNNLSIAGREMVIQGYWQQGLSILQDCLGQVLKLKDFPLYAEISYEVGRAHEMLSDWVNARLYYRDKPATFYQLAKYKWSGQMSPSFRCSISIPGISGKKA